MIGSIAIHLDLVIQKSKGSLAIHLALGDSSGESGVNLQQNILEELQESKHMSESS